MQKFRIFKNFDRPLFYAISFLTIVGLLAIYSSGEFLFFKKQVGSFVIALVVFGLLSFLDYRILKKYAEVIYGVVLVLLLIVLSTGSTVFGAQRWLMFGNIVFQPSEFAKLALIIMLAKYFEQNREKFTNIIRSIPLFIIVALPFMAVFKQPDLGTALVFLVIFMSL